jgi:hypothetical protein
MRHRAFFVALAIVLGSCSHDQSATATTTAQPDSTVAQADNATSQPEETPTASMATSDASTGTQCAILPNAQVEDVVHLTVKDVHVSSSPDRCEFTFKEKPYAAISIEYAPSGGKDDLDSTRRAEGGVQGMVGGLFKAAGGDNNSDAQSVQSVVIATSPPDLPKVGDDQFAYSVGILTSYLATKGDAYVEVGIGGFTPDGMSRWQAIAELSRRVLATH